MTTAAPVDSLPPMQLGTEVELLPGARILVKVGQFFAHQNELLARVLEGEVLALGPRAYIFHGTVCTRESRTCHRCGLEITNPVSIWCGYGPWCSAKLGIVRPESLSEAERQAIIDDIARLNEVEIIVPRKYPLAVLQQGSGMPSIRPTIDFARYQPQPVPIVVRDGLLQVYSRFEQRELCKSVPGARWNPDARCWQYEATAVNAARLAEAFRELSTDPDEATNALLQEAAELPQEQVALPPPPPPRPDIGITVAKGLIRVASKYEHKDLVTSVVGGRWDKEKREWVFPASPTKARDMVRAWGNRGLTITSDEMFKALHRATDRLDQATLSRNADELPNIPGIETEAWTHQRQAYWLIASIWGKKLSLDS